MQSLKIVFPVLLLAACQAPEPKVFSSLQAETDLYSLSPVDVAVLPVEDATPEQGAGHVLEGLRYEIAKALVSRKYTPLDNGKVDEALQEAGASGLSVVDAAWLRTLGGRFGEDATLAVRITRWDQSALMAYATVEFAIDVSMMAPGHADPLWSGELNGRVKSGGTGPAPLKRPERERAAASEVAAELIRLLPMRMR